jgi:hypothetical protein
MISRTAPSDLVLCAAEGIPDWMPEDFRPTRDLLGVKQIDENLELAKQASCEMYITRDVTIPRVLLIHGTDDCQVKDVLFYELEGSDHGGSEFWSKEVMDIIDLFIQR